MFSAESVFAGAAIIAPPSATSPVVMGRQDRGQRNAFKSVTAAIVASTLSLTAPAASAAQLQSSSVISFQDISSDASAALAQERHAAMFNKLQILNEYRAGWSGPGSKGMSPTGYKTALQFIEFLATLHPVALPNIALSSDGEINFYWKNAGGMMDFGINRRGASSYFARLSSGEEFLQDATKAQVRFPKSLKSIFQAS